jgi:hypothetical protein
MQKILFWTETISFWIYKQTWALALFWTLIVLLLTLMIDYTSCLNKALWIQLVFKVAMAIFTMQASIIIVFSYYQKTKIDKNLKEGNDGLSGIGMLSEANYDGTIYISESPKQLFILPLYVIAIYSISKIIIILVKGSHFFYSDEFFYMIMIWGALLIFSGVLWFLLKKYADSRSQYSIKYTLIVITLTTLSIFWQYAVPYVVDIIEVSKCVFSTMTDAKLKT